MTVSAADFPFSDDICISWYLFPIYMIPITLLVVLRQWISEKHENLVARLYVINHDTEQIHNTFDGIETSNLIPANQRNDSNNYSAISNSYTSMTIEEKNSLILEFNKRVCDIWIHYNNKTYNQANYSLLPIDIINIILEYSHSNELKIKMQSNYHIQNKLFKIKYMTKLFECLIYLFATISIVLQIFTFILMCIEFGNEIRDQSNKWHNYLLFNSMLCFHSSFKYVFIPLQLFFAASDDELKTITKEIYNSDKFYTTKFFKIGLIITGIVPCLFVLNTCFTVLLIGILVFVWPFLILILILGIVGRILMFIFIQIKNQCTLLAKMIVGCVTLLFVLYCQWFFFYHYFSTYCFYKGNNWLDCVIYVWQNQYCKDSFSFPLFWHVDSFNSWQSWLIALSLWF